MNGYEEDEDLVQSFAKRFEVVSVTDYGNGHYFTDARDRRGEMAAATRLDDRAQEIPLSRSGDWVYRRFQFRVPLIITEKEGGPTFQFKVDTDGNVSRKIDTGLRRMPIVAYQVFDSHGNPIPEDDREPRPVHTTEERFLLCPLLDTMQQTPRGPFHMIPKWWLDRRLKVYERLQRRFPDYEVPYPMVGLRDRRQEKKARRAIRLRLPGVGDSGFSPDLPDWKRLPSEIRKVQENEPIPDDGVGHRRHLKYVTAIKNLDLRGLTMLAHFDGFLENITAEQVYNNLLETVERVKDPASPYYREKYAGFSVAAPENVGVLEYARWRNLYEDLVEECYDRWYPNEQYRWREMLSDILSRFDNTPAGKARAREALMDLTIHVTDPPEIKYRYVPSRDEDQAQRIQDPDRRREEIERTQFTGHFEPVVDWKPFRCFAEGIEAWRDWNRMIHHWQLSKNASHSRDAADLDEGDIKNSRRNDHGGIWQPVRYKDDWRFMKLWEWAEREAPLPNRPTDQELEIRPDESEDEHRSRVASRWSEFLRWFAPPMTKDFQGRTMSYLEVRAHILGRAWLFVEPGQDMAHDGVLMSNLNDKRRTWVKMIREYVRGQSSNAGVGAFPTYDKLLVEVLARVRNYRDEDDWMDVDEYSQRDPVDAWLHQRAIVSFTVTNEANIRLSGTFRHAPVIYLTYDNCTKVRDFIRQMWHDQPVGPVRDWAWHAISEEVANGELLIRKEVEKRFEGRPPQLDRLKRAFFRYAERLGEKWKFWKSHNYGAARGFGWSDASKMDDMHYGRGFGSLVDWSRRGGRTYELALNNKYGDAMRGILEETHVNPNVIASLDKFVAYMGNFLRTRGLNEDFARKVSTWLKILKIIPAEWALPWENDPRVVSFEIFFANQEIELVGDNRDRGLALMREMEAESLFSEGDAERSAIEEIMSA